jgi:hypothetical protein
VPDANGPTVWEPVKTCGPAQEPLAMQLVAFEVDQVRLAKWSLEMVEGDKAIDTTGCSAVTVSIADFAAEPPAPSQVMV